MIYFDSETCGLHGVAVLFQYAIDDGPVNLHDVWLEEAGKTLDLIEQIAADEYCGFNNTFDLFHINKLNTMLRGINRHQRPIDHIDFLGHYEQEARFTDLCVRPKACLDLMLVSKRTKFQSLMPRDPIRIRRVPSVLAQQLAKELTKQVQIEDIYFERTKEKVATWKVYDRRSADGVVDQKFRDVVLRFSPSGALKALVRHCGIDNGEIIKYKDIEIDRSLNPQELGYAPFALAVTPDGAPWTRVGKWGQRPRATIRSWPALVAQHVQHWATNERARTYGTRDVTYVRDLHHKVFESCPAGDRDSELAGLVAAVRWNGFGLDLEGLRRLKVEAEKLVGETPRDAKRVYKWLAETLPSSEAAIHLMKGTKKQILEYHAQWDNWVEDGVRHPFSIRCGQVIEARKAKKRIEVIDKLLLARRFHADFKVTGALSNRMSGTGGVNAQGIDHAEDFRRCFTFVEDGEQDVWSYDGGDFDSFEVAIAEAVFQDPKLREDLLTGVKIHAIMGADLSGLTYEEVLKTKGISGGARDWYDTGKKGVFLIFYGGDFNTFKSKLGIDIEIGERAEKRLKTRYLGINRFGLEIARDHQAMTQTGGIGTRIVWRDPKTYVESFLGFKRFFDLEYKVEKALFDLAQSPPKQWKNINVRVIRRDDKVQTAGGATSSATYGAAFQIDAGIVRAAKNHRIQSPGAEITKELQYAIWNEHQPRGVHPFRVKPMQVHDELNCLVKKPYSSEVQATQERVLAVFRPKIPLIAMKWKIGMANWSEK